MEWFKRCLDHFRLVRIGRIFLFQILFMLLPGCFFFFVCVCVFCCCCCFSFSIKIIYSEIEIPEITILPKEGKLLHFIVISILTTFYKWIPDSEEPQLPEQQLLSYWLLQTVYKNVSAHHMWRVSYLNYASESFLISQTSLKLIDKTRRFSILSCGK